MIVEIFMKTPDCLDSAICETAVRNELTDDEKDELREKVSKYFDYGEYAVLEYDSDLGTMSVRKIGR